MKYAKFLSLFIFINSIAYASNLSQFFSGGSSSAPVSPFINLSYATTINVDAASSSSFLITLTGNATIANATNLVNGKTYIFKVKQDATGGRTLTWGSNYSMIGAKSDLALDPNTWNMFYFLYDGSVMNLVQNLHYNPPIDASGGTITYSAPYKIHTFTSSGNFVVNSASSTQTVEVLVVAGGGSGGGPSYHGGGGGAGGVLISTSLPVSSQTYAVTVGNGGAAVSGGSNGNNGQNSVFSTLTAIGGGGGGNYSTGSGGTGGSGGGAAYNVSPGSGTSGQGYAGGAGTSASPNNCSGGGGGAGGVGLAGTGTVGGAGGVGVQSAISGVVTYYAGGGGGSCYNGGTPGVGGAGGGGAGSTASATNASPNTGGGGGGAERAGSTSGAGGSGIVIIRYLQ